MPKKLSRMSFVYKILMFPEAEFNLISCTLLPVVWCPGKPLLKRKKTPPLFLRISQLDFTTMHLHLLRVAPNGNLDSPYSNRSISTGRILAAERAGRIVAATLIASAAAAIQRASKPFA
jgi:hypothetical protein